VAKSYGEGQNTRRLFKSTDNSGFIIETFPNKEEAGQKIEVLKAMQGLKEQAMAKVAIIEGEGGE